MTTIYCDEAGNTGANLLDPEQPIFVLASNDFSTEEANELLGHVRSNQADESKFSVLKRRAEGVNRLIRLFADPRVNADRVTTDVYHKRFMVTTKLVDLVVETLMHRMGQDLYKRGANLAMSNMLHFVMPPMCGAETTNQFLSTFVNLVRNETDETKAAYFEAGAALMDATKGDDLRQILGPMTDPQLFQFWGGGLDWSALDPAIPALFHCISVWGQRKADRFDVVHDNSKPVLASAELFRSMMAVTGEDSGLVGYDRRKFLFPLRATALTQADSKQHPQLQIADLCAGFTAHYYKNLLAGTEDELFNAAGALGCVEWGKSGILPSMDVTPEGLDTDDDSGTNAVEGMSEYFRGRQGG